jgi:hypothetical protein
MMATVRTHAAARSGRLPEARVMVPRRKQVVCVGEFKATRLPDYFRLIREQGNRIEVESMRFPIRKTFFNRVGGEY